MFFTSMPVISMCVVTVSIWTTRTCSCPKEHLSLPRLKRKACILWDCIYMYMNNHSAPQEHIERERKDSEHRKNTQNIHNITTIHKPHGLEK